MRVKADRIQAAATDLNRLNDSSFVYWSIRHAANVCVRQANNDIQRIGEDDISAADTKSSNIVAPAQISSSVRAVTVELRRIYSMRLTISKRRHAFRTTGISGIFGTRENR